MSHPNLVRVIGFATQPGLYIAQELMRGQSLYAQLYEEAWEPSKEQLVQVGIDVARGMEYLHSREPPIIHRDLKPANLLYTKTDHVKLLDFGIAKSSLSVPTCVWNHKRASEKASPEKLKF